MKYKLEAKFSSGSLESCYDYRLHVQKIFSINKEYLINRIVLQVARGHPVIMNELASSLFHVVQVPLVR